MGSHIPNDSYQSHCPYCPKKDKHFEEQCKLYRTFDDLLQAINPYGSYQIYTSIIVLLSTLMWEGNRYANYFATIPPTWQCQIMDPENGQVRNMTFKTCPAECQDYVVKDRYFYSVAEQWDLLCDRAYIVDVLTIVPIGGMLIACIFAGHFGEWFGRKKGLVAFQFGVCLSNVLTVASRHWAVFLTFQVLASFFWGCIKISLKTLCLEYTSNKYRIIPTASFQRAFALMFVGLIAYLTKKWYMYLIIINLVTSPVLLGFLVFLESPRWLINQNRLREAASALSDISSARWNKARVTILPQELEAIQRPLKPIRYWLIHLFANKSLVKVTLIQTMAMLTYSFTNSAFLNRISQSNISPFLGIALYGLLQLWVPITFILLDQKFAKFGRKTMYMISLGIMLVSYGSALIIHVASKQSEHGLLETGFAVVGTCAAVTGFEMSIILITVEFYPTVLRNIALGFFYAVDYLGTLSMLIIVSQTEVFGESYNIFYHSLAVATAFLTFIASYFWQVETKFKETTEII